MSLGEDLRDPATIRYLVLSLLTGALELGVVLFAAGSEWSITAVVALGLGYQVAALFVRPFTLGPRQHRVALGLGAVAGVAAFASVVAIPLAVLTTAVGLQGVREEQLTLTSVATLPKRVARIAGFLLAATFNLWWLIALPILVLCVAATHRNAAPRAVRDSLRLDRYALMMVVHQMHYFAYSYALLFVISQLYEGLPFVSVAIFAFGWVTYTSAPLILGRFSTVPVLITGHLFVSVVLLVIGAHTSSAVAVTVPWIVSGFGGGTVFCIKQLAHRHGRKADDLDSWENVGHVAGALCSVAAVGLASQQAPFFLAAALAATTAGLAGFIYFTERARRFQSPRVGSTVG